MLRRPLLLLTAAACGGTEPQPPPVQPAETPIVRPASVDTISLGLSTFTLPPELAGDSTLSVAELASSGVLVGGRGGLFAASDGVLTPIDSAPVRALAALEGHGIVVAGAAGLSLFDGSLQAPELAEALAGQELSALATRGGELWIGASGQLYRYTDGALESFAALPGVTTISTHSGASALVLEDGSGAITALRDDGGSFSMQPLGEEVSASAVVAASGDVLLALAGGALYARVDVDDGAVAWRPVALEASAEAVGASGVEAVTVDPTSGAAWITGGAVLSRLDRGRVAVVERPAGLGVVSASAVTLDGALWLSDGAQLVRLGSDRPPVAYAEIAAFSESNCDRCHRSLGVAHPLDSYEAWAAEVDRIVSAIDEGRMPQDGAPLIGGTVELVKRWRADGLRR